MKFSILVIDDQHDERMEGYDRLAEEIAKHTPGLDVSMEYLKCPNDLPFLVGSNSYSAAIVDAVLDEFWENFNIKDAFKILGNKIPTAIISERYDKTNSEQFDDALKNPNCRTFLHWRDVDPSPYKSGQIDYAIRAMIGMISDSFELNTELKLEPCESIRILHISDIQTGGFKDNNLRIEANNCADKIRNHWGNNNPSFIAFTGDVTEHGDPSQYEKAKEWLEYFLARLGVKTLPSSRILYVPGNHDVNLCLAASARVSLTKDPKTQEPEMQLTPNLQQPSLLSYAYTPFKDFLSEVSNPPFLAGNHRGDNLNWVEARYRHLDVIFYGINTAQPVNAYSLPERQVKADDLAVVDSELTNVLDLYPGSKPIIIGLGHHCPIPSDADNSVSNPEVFETFFNGSNKTAIFLHGHMHKHNLSYSSNNGVRLVRSCAATLTKPENARPSDSLRGFNLLELTRHNNSITALKASSYAWLGNTIELVKSEEYARHKDNMFKEII